jgi:uncharacterized membrane protein
MKNRTTIILLIVILLITAVVSLLVYPRLPEQVASHWNEQGQANGYSGRLVGVLLMPAILLVTAILLLCLPAIDPLKANIAVFRGTYNLFIILFAGFMAYMHILTLLWNLKVAFSFNAALAPAFGMLMYFCGVLLGKARRNFFIGIRTPWTLSSDVVWSKTHRLGSILFRIAGILAAFGLLFPKYMFALLFIPVLFAALIPVVYSYFVFRSESGVSRETIQK